MNEPESRKIGQSSLWGLSLLFPPETAGDLGCAARELDPSAQRDLGIERIAAAFWPDKEKQKEVYPVICSLICNPEGIRYRQEILQDFLDHPVLAEKLEKLFPVIDTMVRYAYRTDKESDSLQGVIWRMGELQSILDCIRGLGEIFAPLGGRLHSKGMKILQSEVLNLNNDATIQRLCNHLPELLQTLRACVSITIGVNLDASLRPVQAVLLSVHDEPFTDQGLINKLFGHKQEFVGIAPLHAVPQRAVPGHYAFPISSELGLAVDPMMVPLFADLARVMNKTTAPIAKQLKRYSEIQGRMFTALRNDLIFYLGAVHLIRSLMEHGLAVCRPDIAPQIDRRCEVSNSYNLNLALHMIEQDILLPNGITMNDILIGHNGRILILTGPNQGGKTTYMQGIGLVQLLAQIGCYVPGTSALISPVDQIYSHFPLEEQPDADTGRFGEEASRMGKIFKLVTRNSLVLLNESLSSTGLGESLYLAQDVVRILRRLGARAIYSTHIYELAERAGEMNESIPGDSQIVSMVSSPVETDLQISAVGIRHSYEVKFRPPLGQSFAREIAARYGISYEQLEKALKERGELPNS